jgi:cation:H+ antiporter
MLLDFGLLALGAVCLYYGAEWLVGGAAGLARRLGIAPLAIGLTVVSYGTSAPELAVSLSAATRGQSAIALGNVLGSNIANIGFILGLSALLQPPRVDRMLFRREVPLLLLATFLVGPALLDGRISRWEGALFCLGALGFTWATLRWAKQRSDTAAPDEEASQGEQRGLGVLWGLLLLGIVVLLAGGQSFVTGAVGIASALGVSERIVGLTVVAFGTSLPELAASVMAAYRGHSDLAVGNVVGSNLFNILLILGLTSVIAPITGSLTDVRTDLMWMTALTVAMAICMYKERRITRWEGGAFLAAYLAFIGTLVLSG